MTIERSPNDRHARLQQGKIEYLSGHTPAREILSLVEGVIPGDETNIDDLTLLLALYWQLEDRDRYQRMRERLRKLDMPFSARQRIALWDSEDNKHRKHHATLTKVDVSYALAKVNGKTIPLMLHSSSVGRDKLQEMKFGDDVMVEVGFSALGAQGILA